MSRLAGWNIPVCTIYVFCSSSVKTRDHLFTTCQYSLWVWKEVLLRCRSPARFFTNWSELLSWIRVSPSKKVTLLRKLACQSVVFHSWKQMNNVVHNKVWLPASLVFKAIDREMRN
ncbi:hypothetical protein Bca101_033799 [Brassica carinata]